MKKIDFWGRDEHDERLLEEVLRGLKTATCTPKLWYDRLSAEEKCEIGEEINLFTKKGEHKGIIVLTDLYEIKFGDIKGEIGERIAKCENSTYEQFIEDHIFSWDEPLRNEGSRLSKDTIIVVEHFELIQSFVENPIDFHIIPMVEEEQIESNSWLDFEMMDFAEVDSSYYSVYHDNQFVACIRYRRENDGVYLFYNINPELKEYIIEKDLVVKAEEYAREVLNANSIILEWNTRFTFQK